MYLKGINVSRCEIMFISVSNHAYFFVKSCLCLCEIMFISVSNHVYFCLKSCLFLCQIMFISVSNHVYSCVNSCLFVCEMMFISFRSLTVIICILFNQDLLCHCFEVTPRFFLLKYTSMFLMNILF